VYLIFSSVYLTIINDQPGSAVGGVCLCPIPACLARHNHEPNACYHGTAPVNAFHLFFCCGEKKRCQQCCCCDFTILTSTDRKLMSNQSQRHHTFISDWCSVNIVFWLGFCHKCENPCVRVPGSKCKGRMGASD